MSSAKNNFDIIRVTDTRITKQLYLLNNLNLNNYSYEFTPTETTPGGTLLYIANHLSYKCYNDLNISAFIEIVNPKKWNTVVWDIHPWILLTLIAIT